MEDIRVVTDSSCDLPPDLIRALDIEIVPLRLAWGSHNVDETEVPREEFWRLVKGPEVVRTSQPSVGAFHKAFKDLVDKGYHVLCATLTSRHSGTFSTAWSVAQEYAGRVTVIDSLSLSLGLGWQAMHAARMATQGATMQSIQDVLRSLRERTHILIALDTLEGLRRGGRAAALMPTIDRLVSALQLKPLLTFVEGELKLSGVVRTQSKALARLKEEIQRFRPWEHLAIMHTRRPELAAQLAHEVATLLGIPFETITVGEAGPVISCHGGEGLMAIVGVSAS